MSVAAIDCGTNSLRLLISQDGSDLLRELRIVRLGQGVDRTGLLDPAAIERARVVLAEYRQMMDTHGVSRFRMVATSATRDAGNAADFQAMVLATLGQKAEVITGTQEAELSFSGAIAGLPGDRDYLVVDIGGGSTEFVRGRSSVTGSTSVDVGTVRIFERHLHSDPITKAERQAAEQDVADTVGRGLSGAKAEVLVGVAGAVTTIAAVAMGPDRLHHATLNSGVIESVTESLCAMTHAERAEIKVIHPGRVDVIVGGALILREVMRQSGFGEIIVSEHDLLDGIASSIN